jgi:hypothetical protein
MDRLHPVDRWLRRYRGDGTAPQGLDFLLTPMIVLGWLGLLWSLPVPRMFSESSPVFNWATLFMMASVVYYFILSLTLAFGLLPFVLLSAVLLATFDRSAAPLMPASVIAMATALAAQTFHHSGTWRSLLQSLLFVMLGPPWLLAALYRRFRIPY